MSAWSVQFEVVRTLYLKPVESSDRREEPLKLKLEVLREASGAYRARMFRLETYSIQASHGTQEVWSQEILVRDFHGAEWDAIRCDDADGVVKAVLEQLP